MPTHSPRSQKKDEPFVIVRIERWIGRRAYKGVLEDVIDFLVRHTDMIEGPSDEFQSSEGDFDLSGLTVCVLASEDGRAIEIAGLFIQQLERRGIEGDPFICPEINPIEGLRKVIAVDLSDPVAMNSWSTLGPMVLGNNGAESFDDVLNRVHDTRETIVQRGIPTVVFAHEGIAAVMTFAELGSIRLRELPRDIPAGHALGFLNRSVTRIPAGKESE